MEPPEIDSGDVSVKSHKDIWGEIMREYNEKRNEIEEYKASKNNQDKPPPHPVVEQLNETLFPTLNEALIHMLEKFKEEELENFTEEEAYLKGFNGLYFVSEYLWNMNPRHPERKDYWRNVAKITWSK